MKRFKLLTASITLLSTIMLMGAPAVAAAKPLHGGSNHGGGGGTTSSVPTGNDISWPQCGSAFPTGQAFGIVGVNDGLANNTNPCFTQELAWANTSSGLTSQPKAALYVNTANPGDVQPTVGDWPTSNVDVLTGLQDTDPYGTCTGADNAACAWQYGYNMANNDANTRGVLNPGTYSWWLDVETGNSWSTNTANNAADLEGMTAYFESIGAKVGIYSTSSQWSSIVGSTYGTTTDAGGDNLNGLPSWLPGARRLSEAQSNCNLSSLTSGGVVSLTQYTTRQADYDYSCI